MKQLVSDFKKGTQVSSSIDHHSSKPLPKFFATRDQTMPREAQDKKMW